MNNPNKVEQYTKVRKFLSPRPCFIELENKNK